MKIEPKPALKMTRKAQSTLRPLADKRLSQNKSPFIEKSKFK